MLIGKWKYLPVLSAAVLLLCGCANETADDSQNDTANDANTIKIGLIVPFSGECAAYGASATKGVELAVHEINAEGGVLGKEIRILTRDSRTDPLYASLKAKQLITDEGVIAILGADASGVTYETMRTIIYWGLNAFLISGAASAIDLTSDDTEDIFYRTVPHSEYEAKILSKYILTSATSPSDSIVSVIYVDELYGDNFFREFSDWFTDPGRGGTIASSVAFEMGKVSYAAEIEALLNDTLYIDTTNNDTIIISNPRVILVSYPRSGAQIIRDWKASGYPARWYLTSGMKAEEFIVSAGNTNVEGMSIIAPFNNGDSYINNFARLYENYWLEDPEMHRCIEHWYDATILLAYAILRADTLDPMVIKESLEPVSRDGTPVTVGQFSEGKELIQGGIDINYEGASGPVDLNTEGDLRYDSGDGFKYHRWTINGGAFSYKEQLSALP